MKRRSFLGILSSLSALPLMGRPGRSGEVEQSASPTLADKGYTIESDVRGFTSKGSVTATPLADTAPAFANEWRGVFFNNTDLPVFVNGYEIKPGQSIVSINYPAASESV